MYRPLHPLVHLYGVVFEHRDKHKNVLLNADVILTHFFYYLQRRFEGTRVTVESFLAWKARFDAETGAKTMQDREEKETRKLTGRELFLTDKTLNESDLKFLEDGKFLCLMECCFFCTNKNNQNLGQNNTIKIGRYSGMALINKNDMKKSMAD
jgi:hypothetical protein